MFASACAVYEPLLVQVGGEDPGKSATFHGTGCLLSPIHFVTANHVIDDMLKAYPAVAVLKYDGLYRAVLLAASRHMDVAVLQATDKLQSANFAVPGQWPTL